MTRLCEFHCPLCRRSVDRDVDAGAEHSQACEMRDCASSEVNFEVGRGTPLRYVRQVPKARAEGYPRDRVTELRLVVSTN